MSAFDVRYGDAMLVCYLPVKTLSGRLERNIYNQLLRSLKMAIQTTGTFPQLTTPRPKPKVTTPRLPKGPRGPRKK